MATQIMHHTNDGHHMAQPDANDQSAYITEYMQSMTAMNHQMQMASQSRNPDLAFAKGMIAHHQGAIEMAKIELKYGKDSQMRALAENIIHAQQDEITIMQNWFIQQKDKEVTISTTGSKTPTQDDMMQGPDKMMKGHDKMMQALMAHDPDVAFAKSMIVHHQGAIDMAETELKIGHDRQLQKLATHIKAAQTPEIKQMQTGLAGKG